MFLQCASTDLYCVNPHRYSDCFFLLLFREQWRVAACAECGKCFTCEDSSGWNATFRFSISFDSPHILFLSFFFSETVEKNIVFSPCWKLFLYKGKTLHQIQSRWVRRQQWSASPKLENTVRWSIASWPWHVLCNILLVQVIFITCDQLQRL